jgi:pimeloyl-ACP methyl ester carboxylesterase
MLLVLVGLGRNTNIAMAKLSDAHEHILNHNGADMYLRTWGEPTARPLVCVHGLTGSSADFKFVGETLSQQGFFVIAPDMVGRGKSSFLKNPHDYCYTRYVDDLNAVMDFFHIEKTSWLGVSMGGLLGIALAGQKNSRISRLILSDVGPSVPQDSLDMIAGYLDRAPVFTTLDDAVAAFKQSINTPFDRGIRDEDLWVYYTQTHLRKNSDGLYERSFDDNIKYVFRTEPLGAVDLWAFWENITQPTLALRGEWSLLFPTNIVDEMRQRKPNKDFSLEVIPNCGHVPSLYVPEQIELISRFLAGSHE